MMCWSNIFLALNELKSRHGWNTEWVITVEWFCYNRLKKVRKTFSFHMMASQWTHSTPHFSPQSPVIDCSLTQVWGQYEPVSHTDYQRLSTLIVPVPIATLYSSSQTNMLVLCPKFSDLTSALMSSVHYSISPISIWMINHNNMKPFFFFLFKHNT